MEQVVADNTHKERLGAFMAGVARRNPGETEFHQAVEEVAQTLIPLVAAHPQYEAARILERLTEPDRIITFRVTWQDDAGGVRVNRAWRVQFNNAIGPYKGGLRFHPTVTQSVLKFLGFEQTLKNSLTGLPMGGAKGGANFNPRGKSEAEVMRFCQAMMRELHRHIGAETDVPAGDIGVGAREIGFLFGEHLRLSNRFTGVFTGKGLAFGGSALRPEATGYGAVYFLQEMLATAGDEVAGKTATVSGSGNVALHAIEKLNEFGAKPVTASDSGGFVYDPHGISGERLAWLKDLKLVRRGRIAEYAAHFGCEYHEGQRPWAVPCQLALPCATQNELDEADARTLLDNGLAAVSEGANMPSTAEAVRLFLGRRIRFGPGKAANAGGVAVSGLEQSQNALRIYWPREEVEERLARIMRDIHEKCRAEGAEADGFVDYVRGANIAGFRKVADAMLAYGAV